VNSGGYFFGARIRVLSVLQETLIGETRKKIEPVLPLLRSQRRRGFAAAAF
jgi:hypothetical protein